MESEGDGDEHSSTTRILTAATVLAGVGAAGHLTGLAAADDGSADGPVGSLAEPALHIYVENVEFHERSTDPVGAPVGTVWYNPSP